MPTDRDEQKNRDALRDGLWEVEGNSENGNQESHVEEQQQRLEQVVHHVVHEFLQDGMIHGRASLKNSMNETKTVARLPKIGRDRRRDKLRGSWRGAAD